MRRGHRDRSARNLVVGVELDRNRKRGLGTSRIRVNTAARAHLIVGGTAETNGCVSLSFFDSNLAAGNIGKSAGAA